MRSHSIEALIKLLSRTELRKQSGETRGLLHSYASVVTHLVTHVQRLMGLTSAMITNYALLSQGPR